MFNINNSCWEYEVLFSSSAIYRLDIVKSEVLPGKFSQGILVSTSESNYFKRNNRSNSRPTCSNFFPEPSSSH